MKNYLFKIKKKISSKKALTELEELGLTNIYTIFDSDNNDHLIGGTSLSNINPKLSCLIKDNLTINWQEQWQNFAENFSNGLSTIDLTKFNEKKFFSLKPGKGFGDLSHSSTYLMLKMMKPYVKNKYVIDIGCGSGILSIASVYMKAKKVIGVDIDKDALIHSKNNAKLNALNKAKIIFRKKVNYKALDFKYNVLINMTFDEQKYVMQNKNLFTNAKYFITSGILKDQKNEYLSFMKRLDLKIVKYHQKKEWMGFIFYNPIHLS
jgi:ribosomal protein L11 methyltransferase